MRATCLLSVSTLLLATGCAASDDTSADTPLDEAAEASAEVDASDVADDAGIEPTAEVARDTISLGVVVDPAWGQVSVAEAFGLFDEVGLNVAIVNFASGAEAMEALLGGAVDVVTAADVPTSAAIVASDEVRVLAQGAYHGNMRIVANGALGIETMEDLDGRSVGTTFGTSAHFMAATFLAQADVAAELVQVAPPELQTALRRGDVDAAAIFEPYATQITAELGDEAVALRGDPPYISLVFYNALADVVQEKEAALGRLLAAFECASTLLDGGDPEARTAVGDATGLDGATLDGVLDGYTYGLSLDGSIAHSLFDLASWAVDEGNIDPGDGLPEFSEALDDGPLSSAADTIVATCS